MLSTTYFERKVKDMPAYKRFIDHFKNNGYTLGRRIEHHFAPDVSLRQVPKNDLRDYLVNRLSRFDKDCIDYISSRPKEYGKQFFKDHIASSYYAFGSDDNIFDWLDEQFIDEELVMCAMIRIADICSMSGRNCKDYGGWFYSVHRRKPELLTYDMYVLGARCFARRSNGKNNFLSITPEEFRTPEYYAAICMMNDTPVMEDIPTEQTTEAFLICLLNTSPENIRCFSESALEKKFRIAGRAEMVKYWQAAVILDGNTIRDIPLNNERIEFFLYLYGKDSCEYACFKPHYKAYLRKKGLLDAPLVDSTLQLVNIADTIMFSSSKLGMSPEETVDFSNTIVWNMTDRNAELPIECRQKCVPKKYAKQYDTEEYLLKIYERLGIRKLCNKDGLFYIVILPEGATVVNEEPGTYRLMIDNEIALEYIDIGRFYDRDVCVTKINCTL